MKKIIVVKKGETKVAAKQKPLVVSEKIKMHDLNESVSSWVKQAQFNIAAAKQAETKALFKN